MRGFSLMCGAALLVVTALGNANLVNAQEKSPPADGVSDLDADLLDDLDRDLLDGLDDPQPQDGADSPQDSTDDKVPSGNPGQTPPDADNPLLDIGRRMRNVEQRISKLDTSGSTQDMQQRIVEDLVDLIEQLNKQCSNASQCQQPNRKQGGRSGGQGSQSAEQASSKPSRDSTNRLGSTKSDAVEGQEVQDVVKQIWGHLPPRVRELMRSASVEKFLPKYEQQIEAYYRRLAEEDES